MQPTIQITKSGAIYNGVTYATSADALAAKRTAEYEAGGVVAEAKRPKATKTAPKRGNA